MGPIDIGLGEDTIRFRDGATYKMGMHSHDDLQITIPFGHTSFEISWRVEENQYEQKMLSAGSICIIPPMHEHKFTWVNKAHFVNLHISPKTIAAQLGDLYKLDELALVEQIGVKDGFLQHLGGSIKQTVQNHGVKAESYYRSALEMALHHVYANYVQLPCPAAPFVKLDKLPCPKIRAAIGYLHANCHRNVTTEELAAVAKMSPFHFVRVFREAVGMPPAHFHMLYRIERAKELLTETGKPVSAIAEELGFCSQGYFGTIFAKHIGCTPTKFRHESMR